MMQLTSLIAASLALVGAANAAPADFQHAAQFDMWNWDCHASGAHTWGMISRAEPVNECYPLALDTRAIEISTIREGCRVTVYSDPLCGDERPAWRDTVGCLWTDSPYRAYKVTCE